ncbi:MAG: geranylgeranyl reductase family protein [Ferruginibacter sp.]|nr:geranylgeranyl reductase family protein [Chitinophagaceae bacterium]
MSPFSHIPSLDADVLIAGAGPAGASAATYLSRAGKRTLLLDFQEFPRDKVCGDFVGSIAIQELDRLGIQRFFYDAYNSSNLITEAALYLDGRELANHHISRVSGLPSFGRVVPRLTLDWWILENARRNGAQVYEQCRVTNFEIFKTHVEVVCKYKNAEKRFNVRALIGADGSSSTTARILTGSKHASKNKMLAVRAYFDRTEGPGSRADVYYSSGSFPGYYWFFPTGKTTANVGIGMVLETFPENQMHLNDLLKDIIEKDPAFRRRIGNGVIQGKITGWPLSTFDPNMQIVADRVLLTGDAAGLINSLNGEGIQTALSSGRWAAEVLIDCLQKDALTRHDLDAYRLKVEREIGSDMMLSQVVIEFIRNRTMSPVWLHLMDVISSRARANPKYASVAGGVISGIVPSKDVLSPQFMAETLMQIGISSGIYSMETILGGPKAWQKSAQSMTQLGLNLVHHGLQKPGEYLKWMQGVSINGLELSRRLWKDFFKK